MPASRSWAGRPRHDALVAVAAAAHGFPAVLMALVAGDEETAGVALHSSHGPDAQASPTPAPAGKPPASTCTRALGSRRCRLSATGRASSLDCPYTTMRPACSKCASASLAACPLA